MAPGKPAPGTDLYWLTTMHLRPDQQKAIEASGFFPATAGEGNEDGRR